MGVVGCDVAQCSGRPPKRPAVPYCTRVQWRCTANGVKTWQTFARVNPGSSVIATECELRPLLPGPTARSRSIAGEGGCCIDHVVAQHPPPTAYRDHGVRSQGAADRYQETVASSLAEACQPSATSKLAAADHPSTVCQQHSENRLFLLSQPIHEGVCVSFRESRTSSGHVERRYESQVSRSCGPCERNVNGDPCHRTRTRNCPGGK
jgi:hypothetical protein